ncbi:MAG: ABC transporter substrate-binding protein [Defluviitaleaceae bacterium]|nr:ABC transporter substrate-binding protein [Defluviitaleaceae bacterium]MCL2836310.1 ABC transporter substrate-binding protein [Defluviitaleaceae bacterium]
MKAKKMLQKALALTVMCVMLFGAAGTAAASAPAGDINRDGVMVFGGQGWQGLFNPIMANNIYDQMVNLLVFDGLVINNAAAEYIPLLATWEMSNDDLTYTFSIDPRACFSDGRPLTAHDVSFTYHTIAHPHYDGPRTSAVQDIVGFEAYKAGQVERITGIRIIDDHTIAFDYHTASPARMVDFTYGILCREYYAFTKWDDFLALIDKPFGNGQFVFVEYVFQQWIELERNDNYWNTDFDVNLAGIIMRDVPQANIVPALVSGQIHVGEAQSNLDNLEWLQADPNLYEQLFVGNSLRQITFNTLRPQLEDYRVRQALAYAFDTEAYIVADSGSPDLIAVGNSPFSPVSWAFPGVDALNNYEFDMDKAHELMDEAGWLMAADGFRYKDGEKMKLHWLIYHEAQWPSIVTGMAAHTWGELGVELDIEMMDFATVQSRTNALPVGEKQFDIFQMGWSMSVDPDLSGGLWDARNDSAGSFFNSAFYHDRLMELIELGAETMDQAERTAIYHEIAAITNYYLPVWVLSNGTILWGYSNSVNGMEISPFVGFALAVKLQGPWMD